MDAGGCLKENPVTVYYNQIPIFVGIWEQIIQIPVAPRFVAKILGWLTQHIF